MAFTCKTCGSGLHSELSRTFGQCGACRAAAESIEAQRVAAERKLPPSPATATQHGVGPPTQQR